MRALRRFGLAMLVTVFALAVSAPMIAGAAPPVMATILVANQSGMELSPDVWGDTVVWQDATGASGDIYAYDVLAMTTTPVAMDPVADEFDPAIDGNRVVYSAWYAPLWQEIQVRDLHTAATMTLTPGGWAAMPEISGDKVVWADMRTGNWDIRAYDLGTSTEMTVTTNVADQLDPAVSGNRVVYADWRNGDWDIYLYDLVSKSENRLTTNAADQTSPRIDGDTVVWQDFRNGNWDIYAYDLSTLTMSAICTDTAAQMAPDVHGDAIVWQDHRAAGVPHAYMYDASDGVTAKLDVAPSTWEIEPRVYGDKVAVHGLDTVATDDAIYLALTDPDAPTTTISGIPAGWDTGWVGGPVTFTLTGDDGVGGSGVASSHYTLNGSAATTYTGATAVSAEGTTVVGYWSVDLAGNIEVAKTATISIDTTAPVTTSDIDPSWQEGPVPVTLFPTDAGSGVAWTLYSVDGAPLAPYAGMFLVSGDGTHTVTYSSADALGHVETPKTEFVRIDDTAPVTTSDIDEAWQSGPVTVTISATDPHSGVAATYYSTDGSDPTVAYGAPFQISAEGTTTVKYFSVDSLGHTETVTTKMVRIDDTAPVIGDDIDEAWQEGPVDVTLTATDPYSGVAGFFFSTDGSYPATPYAGTFAVTSEGTTTVQYRAVDGVGHDSGVTTKTVRIDNTAPVTTSDIDEAWQEGPVDVTLTPTDPFSGVAATYYSTDGSYPTVSYGAPFQITAEGTTTVKYLSVDSLGHTETVTTKMVRIDNTAPVVGDDINEAWQHGPVNVTLTAVDPNSGVAGFFYSTDGSYPTTPYAGTFAVTAEGTTTVQYRAVDGLAHDSGVTTKTVRIDNTAPVTTSDIDPAWQEGPVTVTLTPTDPFSGVAATYYSTDGSYPTVSYGAPFQITAEGTTTVKYISVDSLGNTETVHTEMVRIDNSAPVTSDDIDQAWQLGPVNVTLTAVDPNSGVAGFFYSTDGSYPTTPYAGTFAVTAEGTTTVQYRAVDNLAHDSGVTTKTVRIDNSPPVTTSDIDEAWQEGPVTVTLFPTDPYSGVAATYYRMSPSTLWQLYTVPFVVSSEGTTVVDFYSVDNLSHGETFSSKMVRIDNTAPNTTDDIDEDWQEGPVDVTLTATDPNSGVAATYYSTDGSDPTTTYTATFQITAEGTTTVKYMSVDSLGHTETVTTKMVRIDNTDPVTTSDIVEVWQEGPVTVTLSPTDPYSGVDATYYRVSPGVAWLLYGGPFQVTAEGTSSVQYYSVDNLAHGETPSAMNVMIDNTPPVSTSDIDEDWQSGPVTVTISATDPYSGVAATYYSTDGSDPTVPYAGAFSISAEGTTTVKYLSVDSLGHTETVVSQMVRIDNSPPVTQFLPDETTFWGIAEILFPATDAGIGVASTHYRIDQGVVQSGAGVDITEFGKHDIEYWSVDGLGQKETTQTRRIMLYAASTEETTFAGVDRYATAVSMSQAQFPTGCDNVIVASGANWPDALSGAALAGSYDCPILLTDPTTLPIVVKDEITRLGATKVLLLGGPSAVSLEVELELRTMLGAAAVERFWGPSRMDTANAIARRVVERQGPRYDGFALVATSRSFPDALGASALACARQWPLFLVDETGLSPDTWQTMQDLGVTDVVLLGGTNAVPASVETFFVGQYGGAHVTRLAGANRYGTARAVAEYAVGMAGLQWEGVGFATGEKFPDALAGGVLLGRSGEVLLLTPGTYLHAEPEAALEAHKDDIDIVKFFGGDSAIGPLVRDDIRRIVQ